jgi:hypothetical protein
VTVSEKNQKLRTEEKKCEISSFHGGEYDVQNCLLGCTAVLHGSTSQKTILNKKKKSSSSSLLLLLLVICDVSDLCNITAFHLS